VVVEHLQMSNLEVNSAQRLLRNLDETRDFGLRLGREAQPGDIITLDGGLGAGKTTLTQFIGQGLGVPPDCYITSPTFSIMHEYNGRIPLYHMDLYRLGYEDLEELGLEDYLYGGGLCVIEWPGRLEDLMPQNRLHINLEISSENSRAATLTAYGSVNAPKLPKPPKS